MALDKTTIDVLRDQANNAGQVVVESATMLRLVAEVERLRAIKKNQCARIAILARREKTTPEAFDAEIYRLNMEEEQAGLYRDEQAAEIERLRDRIKELEDALANLHYRLKRREESDEHKSY